MNDISESEKLPPSIDGGPPPESRGAVQLPLSHPVPADSPEYSELWRTALPDGEVADALIRQVTSERRPPRYLAVLCWLLIAAAGLLFYRLWPRAVPQNFVSRLDISFLPAQTGSPELFRRALQTYERREFRECIELLRPEVYRLLSASGGDLRGNRRLLFLYFDSVKNLQEGTRENLELMRQLRAVDPDCRYWDLFHADLRCDGRDLRDAFREVTEPDRRRWESDRETAEILQEAVRKIDVMPLPPKERTALQDQINLRLARILTEIWVLASMDAGWPEDRDSPGVAAREEACAIAEKYPRSREMLTLRRFIAATLRERARGWYWYRTESFYRNEAMAKYLREIDEQLEALEEK